MPTVQQCEYEVVGIGYRLGKVVYSPLLDHVGLPHVVIVSVNLVICWMGKGDHQAFLAARSSSKSHVCL